MVRLTRRVVRLNRLTPTSSSSLVDGDGKRRLRQEQLFRSAAETAMMGYLDEGADMP